MNHCRELVLVGGGHTHALVLHEFAKHPLPHTQITLVSDVEHAPYSGMLPGHIAGFYTHEEMHIDLPSLCQRAGARFISARVDGLDLVSRCALVNSQQIGPSADVLSINVGSSPDMNSVPGVAQWAIPSKPVPQLIAGWERLKTAVSTASDPVQVIIVGGGAGGVELALAMQSQTRERASYTIIQSGPHLVPGHNGRVRRLLSKVLMQRGISTALGQRVADITTEGVLLQNGDWLPADFVFWVTQATAPAWLRDSGLALTDDGFIAVKPTLQSSNDPWVFASGDVATMVSHPTPKAGVFAVRMAAPLAGNLRAALGATALKCYQPQKNVLGLIGTADGRAVASRRWLALHSKLMWRWKDRIDRRFMAQFEAG